MRWQQRCLIDKCKSLVPFGSYIRRRKGELFQFSSTEGRGDCALDEGLLQMEWIGALRPLDGLTVLEIGSGWEPIIPLLYAAAGVSRVYLTDLRRLCSPSSTQWAIRALTRNREKVMSRLKLSEAAFTRVVSADPSQMGLDSYFERLGLRYLAPCDCSRLPLEPASVDVVTSRAVLEHIPAPVIESILKESWRILKPGGITFHAVDPSDHWQHNDNSITKINFLQFSDFKHRLVHTGMNYQNRLRHSEFVQMIKAAGFTMVREEREVDPRSLAALPTMKLAPKYRQFSPEDLATINSFLLGRK